MSVLFFLLGVGIIVAFIYIGWKVAYNAQDK